MYDVAVIGAGINGCTLAYHLKQLSQDVVIFDREGVASGGSGAAGAFLSPKFSKGGELKELLNSALDTALDFYTHNFPQYIEKYNLLHIAQDEQDAQRLRYIKEHKEVPLLDNPSFVPEEEYIYTSKSAIVDAEAMCHALIEDIVYKTDSIETLEYQKDAWLLNGKHRAKKVVLATGAYQHTLAPLPYKMTRGVWGHRIDIATTTQNRDSIHQYVSISPTKEGQLSVGATHNVHYHPQKSQEPYDFEAGREELLEKASRTLKLEDVKVLKDYVGLRSGSTDYLPQIGGIVDVEKNMENLTKRELYTKKPDYTKTCYRKDLYMINGSAGYGFVLAPYLAQKLANHIVKQVELPSALEPARFFYRWVKSAD
ncbi:MAG: FAD-binding oxidoreductase [Sulfurimonas sp.]